MSEEYFFKYFYKEKNKQKKKKLKTCYFSFFFFFFFFFYFVNKTIYKCINKIWKLHKNNSYFLKKMKKFMKYKI